MYVHTYTHAPTDGLPLTSISQTLNAMVGEWKTYALNRSQRYTLFGSRLVMMPH